MKRVLLAFHELAGHTPLYCLELCEYFLSRGFSVTVATNLTRLHEYQLLEKLIEHPHVRFISDTWTDQGSPASRLRGLGAAARETAADLVFLPYAENVLGLLAAQVTRPWLRIPARMVGLFIQSTNYVHQVTRPQTGRIGRVIERPVLAVYRYRPLRPRQWRIFHEVYMRRFAVLDAALCLDEVFAAEQDDRYQWLPDIVAFRSDQSGDGSAEAAEWQAQIADFLADHEQHPIVVYLGMPQSRRGYEELLQLTYDIGGCFIHCGPLQDVYGLQILPTVRDTLISSSAILELGHFYQSSGTAAVTLSAARCVVLPYQSSHLGSSGVMFQALVAGRPVLVPDRGLMGWRVRNFGLGLTFAPGDSRDMRYRFELLQTIPPGFFADSIAQFLAYFSRAQFEAAMDAVLGLPHAPVRVPRVSENTGGKSQSDGVVLHRQRRRVPQ